VQLQVAGCESVGSCAKPQEVVHGYVHIFQEAKTNPEVFTGLDSGKNVGVRLKVVEREDLSTPVLQRLDEDVPVSYTVQYKGAQQSLLGSFDTAG
jgi:hypothetical protein